MAASRPACAKDATRIGKARIGSSSVSLEPSSKNRVSSHACPRSATVQAVVPVTFRLTASLICDDPQSAVPPQVTIEEPRDLTIFTDRTSLTQQQHRAATHYDLFHSPGVVPSGQFASWLSSIFDASEWPRRGSDELVGS